METEELKTLRVRMLGLSGDMRYSDYHNWEDDSAVLVDITAPHTEDPVRRFGRRKGG